MSRPLEGAPGKPPGLTSLLLQLRETSQGTEIRPRSQDTGHAGWVDQEAANVQGDLLPGDAFLGAAKCHVRVLRLRLVGLCGQLESFYGGVATLEEAPTQAQLYRWAFKKVFIYSQTLDFRVERARRQA